MSRDRSAWPSENDEIGEAREYLQENAEVAEELVGDFRPHGHWIAATQPVRAAAAAASVAK